MTLTARTAVLLVGAGLLLGACAQPDQLGQPVAAAPVPAAPAVAAPPAPVPEPATGTMDAKVTIRTPGPAVYAVRTVVLAPGEAQQWHRHPGTEMSIVRTGAVILVRDGACTPARFGEGQALFVADAAPHRLTNDGTEPAELVVTTLLAPDAPADEGVPSPCPED